MGKPPSQRRKEQEARRRTEAATEAARRSRGQRVVIAVVVIMVVAALAFGSVLAFILGNDDDAATTPTSTTSPATSSTTSTTPSSIAPPVSLSTPPAGDAITGETPCPAEDGSSARVTSFENAPPTCIDPTKQYYADVTTSAGNFRILLDPTSGAPETINNFIVLSRYHFYDGVPFHTILPNGFVVTGDATGDPVGTGGPGYTIESEVPEAGVLYLFGTVAMFNDGAPGQNGSRFIVATGEMAADLEPIHTAFGLVTVDDGTLRAIERAGDPTTGDPIETVIIDSVVISEVTD